MQFYFWKNWSKVEQILCSACLFLLALGTLSMLTFWYRGIENVVRWDILSELDETLVAVDNFQNFNLLGKAYLVKEQFVASQMQIENWHAWGYLAFIILGVSLVMAAVSALNTRGFLIGMTIFTVVLAFSQLETLQLFGSNKPVALGLLLLVYGGGGYYFNAFRPDIVVFRRIFLFFLVTVFFLLIIGAFAKIPNPISTFTAYSLSAFGLLSVVIIFWLAFEILAALVYVVTSRMSGLAQNSLLSFLFVSVLYLLSIFLIYLKISGQSNDNFLIISPIVLVSISIWLGLWGSRLRTEPFFSFREIGVWLYVGLGFILIATLSYSLATANNSMISVFENAFVFSQLGLGVMFVFYVGINFYPLFKKGYEVHKVLYKPLKFSLWQTWVVGLSAVLGLLALEGSKSYYQFWAGRYNALGDLYAGQDLRLSEGFYKLAAGNDPMNHKSNFALASLALSQGDRPTAGAYFQQAITKNPSPQAFVGLSNALMGENLFFDAIFNLRKGAMVFRNSGEIQNNLGYLYSKTKIADSTFYYYDLARQNSKIPKVPQANLLAFFAKNPLLTPSEFEKDESYNSVVANALVLSKNKNELPKVAIELPADSGLSVNNFAYLYNRALFLRDTNNTTLLQKLESTSSAFYDELQMARAYTDYYNGNKINGLDLLASKTMSDTSQKVALERSTLTFWLDKELNSQPIVKLKTAQDYAMALRRNPLNLTLLENATGFYNQQKQPKLAYDMILNALRFLKTSPQCQKLYILQCLEMRLSTFAEEGLRELFALTSAADYAAFERVYEQKRKDLEQNW